MGKHDKEKVTRFSWDVPDGAFAEAENRKLKAENAKLKEKIASLEREVGQLEQIIDSEDEIKVGLDQQIMELQTALLNAVTKLGWENI